MLSDVMEKKTWDTFGVRPFVDCKKSHYLGGINKDGSGFCSVVLQWESDKVVPRDSLIIAFKMTKAECCSYWPLTLDWLPDNVKILRTAWILTE
jgi:hypothetical protein